MNSDDRTTVSVVMIIGITLLVAIFLMSGCVVREAEIEKQTAIECVTAGGEWLPARGSQGTFSCEKVR